MNGKKEVENSTFFSEFVNKGKMVILDKMHHEVSGTGYRCHAKRKDFTYRRSFFGVDTIEESEWINIKLTEKDCWEMVNTKRCKIETENYEFDKKLHCEEEKCEFY